MPRFESNVGDIEGHGPASADPPIAPSSRAFRRRHDGRVERSGFEARLGVRRLLRILSRPLHGRVFRSAARRLPRARALAVARRVHRDVQQERRRAAARGPPEPEPRRRRQSHPVGGSSNPVHAPGAAAPPCPPAGVVHARLRNAVGASPDVSTASADGMTRRRGASHHTQQPTPSFQPPPPPRSAPPRSASPPSAATCPR